jgi:GNAT superfamily N-acetyltransferase
MNLKITTLAERPELEEFIWDEAFSQTWSEFMHHNPTENQYFSPKRFARYFEYIMVAFKPDQPEKILARSFSVPFALDARLQRHELPDGGWDAVVRWADEDFLEQRLTKAVSALEIAVHPDVQKQGLSGLMLEAMKKNVQWLGATSLYAPVRPTLKHLEPSTPMQDYAARVREDGLPFDPWIRLHVKAGGKILKVAPHSAIIAGTLDQWRAWTGLPFDQSGEVIVPKALVPVYASVAQNHAVYVEPNVWMQHPI